MTPSADGLAVSVQTRLVRHAKTLGVDPNLVLTRFVVESDFVVFVAEARVTSPVTQENWEGRGVRPHVEVPAKSALEVAQRLAIERLARRE